MSDILITGLSVFDEYKDSPLDLIFFRPFQHNNKDKYLKTHLLLSAHQTNLHAVIKFAAKPATRFIKNKNDQYKFRFLLLHYI